MLRCVPFIPNLLNFNAQFSKVILIIRGIITKFNKSHIGTAELKTARAVLSIGRGLEAVGKTRFGTIIMAAKSVHRNLPAIKRVVKLGKFDLGVSHPYY